MRKSFSVALPASGFRNPYLSSGERERHPLNQIFIQSGGGRHPEIDPVGLLESQLLD